MKRIEKWYKVEWSPFPLNVGRSLYFSLNMPLSVSLPGNIGNSFTIDPILGSIKTARELDRSNQVAYDLMVKATDKGDPQWVKSLLCGSLWPLLTTPLPSLHQEEYSVEISETVGVGSFVEWLQPTASHQWYMEIKDGNVADTFDINPHSGSIITRKALDFETLPIYTLTIQGTNMAGLSTNATRLVHLLDENDNLPVLCKQSIQGSLVNQLQLTAWSSQTGMFH